MRLSSELLVLPPMYGREEAGQSSTMATHHPLEITSAKAAQLSWTSRRASRGLAHNRYTSPNAGSTINASSVLVRKAKPTREAQSTSRLVFAVSRADHNAHAAATRRKVNNASGLLSRNISVAIGVTARATAPKIAAPSPTQRRIR